MKVLIVSFNDSYGGAAKAALRLQKAFDRNSYISSKMLVRVKNSEEENVIVYGNQLISKIRYKMMHHILNNKRYSSLNVLPSSIVNFINDCDCDVVNLHWINCETLPIYDLKKIKKPIVWTFHDMWGFSGIYHLNNDNKYASWHNGKDFNEKIDKFIFTLKKTNYPKFQVVTPSLWMAECVKQSCLLKDNEVHVIPNIINNNYFKYIPLHKYRDEFNFSKTKKIILFGAVNSSGDKNKGGDLLIAALRKIETIIRHDDYACVIFGHANEEDYCNLKMEKHFMGYIESEFELSKLYNLADVTIVPSLLENLPQVSTEAQMCGCPVVGFNSSGVKNTIINNVTGSLAISYSITSLANAILSELSINRDREAISKISKQRWSERKIVNEYIRVFENACV